MKKKLLLAALAVAAAVCIAFGIAACGPNDDNGNTHTAHNWSSNYIEEGDMHYQTCDGCDERQYSAHDYDVNGVCVLCGKTKPEIPATDVFLNKTELTLEIGDEEILSATVIPDDATNKSVTWESDNPTIAGVNNEGKVTALSEGVALITATTANGISAFCYVTVNATIIPAENISLDKTELSLGIGDWEVLSATVSPENATDKSVTWESDKPDIASVSDGVVAAHAQGTAVITATTANGISAQCTVTVAPGLRYELNEDMASYRVASIGTITDADIEIPSEYKGLPVTSIGAGAFHDCTSLESVTMSDNMSSIGINAFNGCTSLENVTIGNKVTSIGDRAFHNCTSLENIIIPDGVISIGIDAFWDCYALTSINIPDSVISIGEGAFMYCTSLQSATIGNGVDTISNRMFYACFLLENVTIGSGVISIESEAFDSCYKLDNVILPDGVASIGDSAFHECYALTSITIPEKVKTIGAGAFGFCEALERIVIGGGVTSIGVSAFYDCKSLESITIPDSVTSIGEGAFRQCTSLQSATIGSGVVSVSNRMFDGCALLESVTIGSSVTSIGTEAFRYTSLDSIILPDGVTSIGEYAFIDCRSLKSVTMPNSLTVIGIDAFAQCYALASIIIPDKVASISDSAFYYCTSLESIVIGNGVTSIDSRAFFGCNKLTSVYYNGTAEDWAKIDVSTEDNAYLMNATRYYYSANKPTEEGNFWRYVDNVPTPWAKED